MTNSDLYDIAFLVTNQLQPIIENKLNHANAMIAFSEKIVSCSGIVVSCMAICVAVITINHIYKLFIDRKYKKEIDTKFKNLKKEIESVNIIHYIKDIIDRYHSITSLSYKISRIEELKKYLTDNYIIFDGLTKKEEIKIYCYNFLNDSFSVLGYIFSSFDTLKENSELESKISGGDTHAIFYHNMKHEIPRLILLIDFFETSKLKLLDTQFKKTTNYLKSNLELAKNFKWK
jgi:hypothetical protein